MSPLIETNNLSVGYSTGRSYFRKQKIRPILKDINLTIPSGQTLGLVGESGCGKTTLGRAILGLAPIVAGEIKYHRSQSETVDLHSLSESEFRHIRKDLQLIFQDPYSSLNPQLRIGQILIGGIETHFRTETKSEHLDRAIRALSRVGLESSTMDRYPHEFSGGQRQRVSIARAISLEPKFIVCDECVSALDVSIQAQILNLLLDLQNESQLTYLFISHDLNVVRHISHKIAVMDGGEIVEYDESDKLFEQPSASKTRELLAASPKIKWS